MGLGAVVLKETNEKIDQCGLTMQQWRENEILEIGYLFQKAHWHKGYATEAKTACKEYAFVLFDTEYVYLIIRNTNIASQNVAVRNGMRIVDNDFKNFRNVDMEVFCIPQSEQIHIMRKKEKDKFRVDDEPEKELI